MLAISVREAIRDAIAQFGVAGAEVPLACPSTHEAIFTSIQTLRAQAGEPAHEIAQ
jgi:xanthine dehydrogenase molybdopterin-binding subunit B